MLPGDLQERVTELFSPARPSDLVTCGNCFAHPGEALLFGPAGIRAAGLRRHLTEPGPTLQPVVPGRSSSIDRSSETLMIARCKTVAMIVRVN